MPTDTPGPFARPKDASEQIAMDIRRYVGEHGLGPGDRLGTEKELAIAFGVSRPTLREALQRLAGSRLIRAAKGPGGGIFVASTPNEGMGRNVSESIAAMLETESVSLTELVVARIHLEVPLAGLAARNATAETAAQLESAIAEAEGNHPASEEFRLADTRFHDVIAATAGNELLRAFTAWILDVLQPSLIQKIGSRVDGDAILAQHREILRAIRRRQATAAERAMRGHLEYVLELVASLEARH